jgi:hypothetical protein
MGATGSYVIRQRWELLILRVNISTFGLAESNDALKHPQSPSPGEDRIMKNPRALRGTPCWFAELTFLQPLTSSATSPISVTICAS